MTLCAPVFWLKRFQIFGFRRNIYLPIPLTKSHISLISAFLSKLKPSLLACSAAPLAGDPPSCYSALSIQAGNPHQTPVHLVLSPATCVDRRHDNFHPNHHPLHQISSALSHGARSIVRISRSIWQWRSKSWPHARMRS